MYTNKKRSENDQYNETSNHRQMKGYGPRGPKPCCCRRPLSFVYGLMSHCIDRFHFVFYLYTFHFMLPMCIWLICETVNLIVLSTWIFLTVSTVSFAGWGGIFLTAFKHYTQKRHKHRAHSSTTLVALTPPRPPQLRFVGVGAIATTSHRFAGPGISDLKTNDLYLYLYL